MSNLYKSVLNSIPTAAIVVDRNMRVRYANKAFRDYFSSVLKGKGSLRDAVSCGEKEQKCGYGIKCAYCPIRNLFSDAIGGNGLAFRNIILKSGEDGEKNVGLRIKVKPLGKLFLGIVDNAYEMEIAQQMD